MKYFKTKENYPYMANHNRSDKEITKEEHDVLSDDINKKVEDSTKAINDSLAVKREEENIIQMKIREIAIRELEAEKGELTPA